MSAQDHDLLQPGTLSAGDPYIETFRAVRTYEYVCEFHPNMKGSFVGQRQLLSFARALLAAPSILILDEATSSINLQTEALIQQALRRLLRSRTSFVIAHRLSTIREVDLVVVMHQGRIAEQGTHDDLLAREGLYASLHGSQWRGDTATD